MKNLCIATVALTACSTGHDLVGDDLDAVRALYGPPLAVTAAAGMVSFTYADRDGKRIDDAIVAVDEVVVRCAPDLVPNRETDVERALVGASVEEAVAALGPARNVAVGAVAYEIEFATCTAQVVCGRVIGLRRP